MGMSLKAKDFDQKFEAGENLPPYLDLCQAKRLGSDRLKSTHECKPNLSSLENESLIINPVHVNTPDNL
jgi:hypothetical protein